MEADVCFYHSLFGVFVTYLRQAHENAIFLTLL
jgi:hypothetical protein